MKEILQLANQGGTDAQCLMGNMYDRGVVMPQDYAGSGSLVSPRRSSRLNRSVHFATFIRGSSITPPAWVLVAPHPSESGSSRQAGRLPDTGWSL